jgi:hypothetical protein
MAFANHAESERARLRALQDGGAIDLDAIPAIMRAFAEKNGGTIGGPRTFMIHHEALLRTGKDQDYFAITATQLFGTRTPSIVWFATGTMFGVVPIAGIDTYLEGAGEFEIRIAGAVPVTSVRGESAARGEIIRALSELPVHPDAILNMAGLTWRQSGPDRVQVTAQTPYGPVSGIFVFDAAGDIVGFEADRPNDAAGAGKTMPWRGTYGDYKQMGQWRIPTYGEVGWEMPDGFFLYWKGRVVSYAPE